MATKKTQQEDPEVVIESAIGRAEGFIERNAKSLTYIAIAIIVIVCGYFGWKYLYAIPREGKAADAMFVAEQLFIAEDYQQALDGDGNNEGLLEVIDQWGSTAHGNLARQYAGICYMKLDKPEEALDVLSKYKTSKGAPNVIVNAQNFGLRGDLLAKQGKDKEALDMYRKAIAAAENSLTTPFYLKKAGILSEKTGDFAGAKAFYQRIADEFGMSMEARDIEKSIGRAEQL
ncbi:MAG: tetratricopeptide repeat protein [Rikenellaceae bacterium]|jgi:predicted negative regulator of RcsB-dependent stress response|nr:tetratricopeptide repeat protein [Rikenellaceae bacterium]